MRLSFIQSSSPNSSPVFDLADVEKLFAEHNESLARSIYDLHACYSAIFSATSWIHGYGGLFETSRCTRRRSWSNIVTVICAPRLY
ncbi:hypothetical protein Y032_0048g1621 [Ancylostoma ceylanicum]|uniref:Uncharacterized protein n=1 Tax=Ancylostoma ceylanicum TaxID=53326 RepID=A0A016UBB6_9BILA|nr:hypothetical protein Y032_0048g1621 [Ancylostoma ceylanicum]